MITRLDGIRSTVVALATAFLGFTPWYGANLPSEPQESVRPIKPAPGGRLYIDGLAEPYFTPPPAEGWKWLDPPRRVVGEPSWSAVDAQGILSVFVAVNEPGHLKVFTAHAQPRGSASTEYRLVAIDGKGGRYEIPPADRFGFGVNQIVQRRLTYELRDQTFANQGAIYLGTEQKSIEFKGGRQTDHDGSHP